MQILRELYQEIAIDNNRWSYYRDTSFSINGKWDNSKYAPQQKPTICSQKISYNNKLCYILSIADAIEPVKRDPKYLDEIRIGTVSDGIELEVSEDIYHKIYEQYVPGLEDWIDIRVSIKIIDGIARIRIQKLN